jgi:hypothetical protein
MWYSVIIFVLTLFGIVAIFDMVQESVAGHFHVSCSPFKVSNSDSSLMDPLDDFALVIEVCTHKNAFFCNAAPLFLS